jgi:hypothetical protein
MFVGAMQEHIFSNPKYVDEAESFGKVSERFHLLTISREDIKKVISKRVLDKNAKQRLELESVSINLEEMAHTIFSESQLVDYPTFEKKLNEFKQKLVAGKDLAKIRLKLGEAS